MVGLSPAVMRTLLKSDRPAAGVWTHRFRPAERFFGGSMSGAEAVPVQRWTANVTLHSPRLPFSGGAGAPLLRSTGRRCCADALEELARGAASDVNANHVMVACLVLGVAHTYNPDRFRSGSTRPLGWRSAAAHH